jgi:hypothetical protein
MIDRKFIVPFRDKDFPLYAGVLDAATRAGLNSLTTTVIQLPTAENGNLAVVSAKAVFEDGRVFEDIGDCSPASTTPQLASALLRLASTRAKGRCLRDAINVGQTMYEELPECAADADQSDEVARPLRPARLTATGNGHPTEECSNPGCGKPLTKGQHDVSLRAYGQPLCPQCQKQFTRIG